MNLDLFIRLLGVWHFSQGGFFWTAFAQANSFKMKIALFFSSVHKMIQERRDLHLVSVGKFSVFFCVLDFVTVLFTLLLHKQDETQGSTRCLCFSLILSYRINNPVTTITLSSKCSEVLCESCFLLDDTVLAANQLWTRRTCLKHRGLHQILFLFDLF